MKKILFALLCLLMLVGCAAQQENEKDDNQPTVEENYDLAKFNEEMAATSADKVRFYIKDEGLSLELDEKLTDKAEFKEEIAEMIKSLDLTKSSDQEKYYGQPIFFIDLNTVIEDNYRRFIVYGDVVVLQANDKYYNYEGNEQLLTNISKLAQEASILFAPEEE